MIIYVLYSRSYLLSEQIVQRADNSENTLHKIIIYIKLFREETSP